MSSFFLDAVPAPGESLNSLLMRKAELNGYGSAQALLREVGLRVRVQYSLEELDQIADVFELDAELMKAWRAGGQDYLADLAYLRTHEAAICPHCLAEEHGFAREAWSHALVTACPDHRVQLVGQCPGCHEPLRHSRHHLLTCDCGYRLATCPIETASDFAVGLSAFLAGLASPARAALPAAINGLEYEPALPDFLVLLGKSHGRAQGCLTKSFRFGGFSLLADARTLVGCLEQLLSDWPRRFDEVLVKQLAHGEGISLAERIGTWYRQLFSIYTAPAFDFLRERLRVQVAEHFDGRLGLSTRAMMFGADSTSALQWFSAAEAARLIGVAPDILANLVINQIVEGRIHVEGKSRFVAIHRNTLDQIVAERKAFLSVTEARQRLNVSKVFFERFVQAGGLRRYKRDERPPLVAGEYRVDEVDALIATLVGRVIKGHRPAQQVIGIQDISAKHGISNAKVVGVLQDILHGTIRPIGYVPSLKGLAGLQFGKGEIERRVRDNDPDVALSVDHLAQVSGWKPSVIKKWIQGGYLHAVEERHGKAKRDVVPVSALIQFLLEYTPTSDLSKRLDTQTNYLLMTLRPARVDCVMPPQETGGAHRGLLLRIDDLVRGAQLRKQTLKELADQFDHSEVDDADDA